MDGFDQRWQHLAQAARRAPSPPAATLDVDRILAARRRPGPKTLAIGWLPPGLAAAAVLALGIASAAGLDPRPSAVRTWDYLSDLPQQVPRAPALPPPMPIPSPQPYLTHLTAEFLP